MIMNQGATLQPVGIWTPEVTGTYKCQWEWLWDKVNIILYRQRCHQLEKWT